MTDVKKVLPKQMAGMQTCLVDGNVKKSTRKTEHATHILIDCFEFFNVQ